MPQICPENSFNLCKYKRKVLNSGLNLYSSRVGAGMFSTNPSLSGRMEDFLPPSDFVQKSVMFCRSKIWIQLVEKSISCSILKLTSITQK